MIAALIATDLALDSRLALFNPREKWMAIADLHPAGIFSVGCWRESGGRRGDNFLDLHPHASVSCEISALKIRR